MITLIQFHRDKREAECTVRQAIRLYHIRLMRFAHCQIQYNLENNMSESCHHKNIRIIYTYVLCIATFISMA